MKTDINGHGRSQTVIDGEKRWAKNCNGNGNGNGMLDNDNKYWRNIAINKVLL